MGEWGNGGFHCGAFRREIARGESCMGREGEGGRETKTGNSVELSGLGWEVEGAGVEKA